MWATGFWMIMVSVSSITEQLCKQKLEDGWTSSESERRAGIAFSGCPATEGEGKENTTAGHSTLRGFDESKLNNNIRGAGAAGNEDDITKDCDWYTSQAEQMPPVKKHRRSFSIPGGTKSDTGLELCHIQHSQSTLNTAVLRPVAVRPRLAVGLRDSCRDQAVTAKGIACDAVTKSSSFTPHPVSISGSSSGFYRHPATDFVGAAPPRGGFHGSGLARSVGMAAGKLTSETAFCFSTNVRPPADCVGKDSVPSLDLSSSIRSGSSVIGSRSPSSVISSNSDLTLFCQRSCAPKQCPLRTPERKTGLKRRRDDDRPTLDFFKMIETAYERGFCSSSISQQTCSKGRFKSDACSPSVNQTPNVDCSSPCSLLDSTETRGASPASPFISLHRHFLADETDTVDDDTTHFTGRRSTATECNSDRRSKENWKNIERTLDSSDRILLGSEFDLDLIENN